MLNKRFESLKDSILLICLGIASYDVYSILSVSRKNGDFGLICSFNIGCPFDWRLLDILFQS